MHIIKGYRIPSILQEEWAFSANNYQAVQFPKISKDVFLAQSNRLLDILVGTDALSLLPKCNYGPDFKDCIQCYKFWSASCGKVRMRTFSPNLVLIWSPLVVKSPH